MKCTNKEQYEFIQYTGNNEDEIIKLLEDIGYKVRITISPHMPKIEIDMRYDLDDEADFDDMMFRDFSTMAQGEYIIFDKEEFFILTPEDFNKYYEVVK